MRTALTIAGSDPSGGAGIQADLKTFRHFNIHGFSAITAIALQDSSGVKEVIDLKAPLLEGQLEVLFSDFRIDAVKTGMLYSKENILTVAHALERYRVGQYILDPIIISSSGFPLLQSDAVSIIKERLFPLAALVTPNLKEAETLSGRSISDEEGLRIAAEKIYSLGPKYVLIKGFKSQDKVVDLLYAGKKAYRFESDWIPDKNIHGAGCVLSAAITATLSSGKEIHEAIEIARSFVLDRINGAASIGKERGFSYLT